MPMRIAFVMALLLPCVVAAQGAADPRAAAQGAIAGSPDRYRCPLVSVATRLADGTIRVICQNGESMVVLNRNGQLTPMRCSDARRQGIAC